MSTKISLQIGNKRLAIVTEQDPEGVQQHVENCGALFASWWDEVKDLPDPEEPVED